jgi:hypothetical protein
MTKCYKFSNDASRSQVGERGLDALELVFLSMTSESVEDFLEHLENLLSERFIGNSNSLESPKGSVGLSFDVRSRSKTSSSGAYHTIVYIAAFILVR